MVARGKSLPKVGEIEMKMEELRQMLEQKEPKLSGEEIEELMVYLSNQNYV